MIILLGGNGYVGSAFRAFFEAQGIPYLSVTRSKVDYTDAATLTRFLRETRPEFLLCAAGYTGRPNVDACELHKAECLAGNAVLPGTMRTACEEVGVPFGYVSSGCIFTGQKRIESDGRVIGFSEEDAPNFSFRQNNCSFYSGTKALGEEILAGAAQAYVWRLRIPFDHCDGPRNYLSKLMRYERLLQATNSLSHLGEFVQACWQTWARRCPAGIYNVTNPGYITTQEAVELIRRSGVSSKPFSFFASEGEFMQIAAKTPRSNCVLDSSKLASCGIAMTEVHQRIEQSLRDWIVQS